MLAVIGVIGYLIRPTRHTTSAAPSATPARPAVMLDGTYRLDFDNPKGTINGAPSIAKKGNTTWWAFRSSCGRTGCTATGTQLDDNNHQVAMAGGLADTAVFSFIDGHWQEAPNQTTDPCDQDTTSRSAVIGAMSLKPQADGTLQGEETTTVIGAECGAQGSVYATPVALVRVGDVAPGVTVADPAAVAATTTTSNPPPTVAGPRLDGTYRVDFELAGQTINGAHGSFTAKDNKAQWWAFRSVCAASGCVAVSVALADENHQEPTITGEVFRFVDGHWQQNTPYNSPSPCPGKNGPVTETLTANSSFEPQDDGTLRGAVIKTALTNECGLKGTVWRTPVTLTRVGDVPPTVVIADPALLVSAPIPTTTPVHSGG
jgi:hypothetical protein